MKKNYILFFILLLLAYSCQNDQKNSTTIETAATLIESNPKQALDILNSIEISTLNEVDGNYYLILTNLVNDRLGIKIGLTEQTMESFRQIVKKIEETNCNYKTAIGYYVLSKMYINQKDYLLAKHFALISDEYAEKSNYKLEHFNYSFIPYNIARLYSIEKNYQKALLYHYKTELFIGEGKGDSEVEIFNNESMGIIYKIIDLPDSAFAYQEKALQLAEKHSDITSISRISRNIARLYQDLGEYESAKTYCKKSLELISNDENELGQVYLILSEIYSNSNQIDSAYFAIKKAEKHLVGQQRTMIYLYKQLSFLEEQKGDKFNASKYRDKYNDLVLEQEKFAKENTERERLFKELNKNLKDLK